MLNQPFIPPRGIIVMTKKAITKRILLYELFGFTLIVVFLWLSETADLPHTFFGAPATPVNIVESAYESGMVLAMAAAQSREIPGRFSSRLFLL